MKKILLALLIAVMVICCTACGNDVSATSNHITFEDRFDEIDWNTRLGIGLFVDTKTGVEYLISYHGGATVVVDTNGTPLFYTGD